MPTTSPEISYLHAEREIVKLMVAFSEGHPDEERGIERARAILRDTHLSPAEERAANVAFLEVEGDLSAARVIRKCR